MANKTNDDYVCLFWSNIEVKGEHWVWKGHKSRKNGVEQVGTFRVGRDIAGAPVTQRADRWAYEHYNEEKVPAGKIVRPSCGESMCVNPKCLRVVDVPGRDVVQFRVGNQVKKNWWASQKIDRELEPGRSIRNGKP